MHVLLVRHGQTESNIFGLLDSAVPGPGLTPLGHAQAAAIPRALRGRPVSSITTSTLTRTHQTASPLAVERGLEIRMDHRLREIPAGDVEMRGDAEAVEIFAHAAWGWSAGELDRRIPGSENGHEFFARFDNAMDEIMARGEELPVVVSHAGCLRAWVGLRAANTPATFAADTILHNTGWAMLDRDSSGRWALLEWHADPMGGAALRGPSGPGDPTGTTEGEAIGPGR